MSRGVQDNTNAGETAKGYRTAFKATAIFGGSQVITILISIIRTKLVAVWLGPAGMGLMGLFNTSITLVQNLTNLGLQSSAVREIAKESNNPRNLSRIVTALNRWALTSGIAGTLITVLLAPLLSRIYFDNTAYTLSFVFLSIIVLLQGLSQQQSAILQGMRRIKDLVKANIYGALIGFVVSIPLFYLFRDKGIVPALVLTSAGALLATSFYSRRVEIAKDRNQSFRETLTLGTDAVRLGIAMSLSMIMVSVVEFIVRSYMARHGGVAEVGLYSAGWAINAQYLGLIFTAMGKDYFPRLSQQCNDNAALRKMINAQGEIAVLILTPMIAVMFISIPLVVLFLYTKSFDPAIPMIKWLLIGSLIKGASWSISFLFLAKSDSKWFLINELGIKFVTLPSYLLGYKFFGLTGIGYAYAFNYTVYFLLESIVAWKIYRIKLDMGFYKLFGIDVAIILSMAAINVLDPTDSIYLLCIVACLALAYNLIELNKRLSLTAMVTNRFRKGRK